MDQSWKKTLLEIDGNTLEFIEKGSGAAIVFLHAVPGSYDDYAGVLDFFSKSHRVIALAWPLYGSAAQSRARIEQSSPLYFSQLFSRFLKSLNIQRAILVGNSVGGYVALRTAIDMPSHVRGLVLINSAGFTKHNFFTRLFCLLKGTYLGTKLLCYPLAKLYLRNSNAVVQDMLRRARAVSTHPMQIAIEAQMWRSFMRADSSLISQVENLKTPMLLFWGKYDIILPWWTDGKTCARALPNAKLVLTKTGHAPHAETSELFIEETSGFLKTLNN